jgi:hypothetical protein
MGRVLFLKRYTHTLLTVCDLKADTRLLKTGLERCLQLLLAHANSPRDGAYVRSHQV